VFLCHCDRARVNIKGHIRLMCQLGGWSYDIKEYMFNCNRAYGKVFNVHFKRHEDDRALNVVEFNDY
jgi:hypothetical protein